MKLFKYFTITAFFLILLFLSPLKVLAVTATGSWSSSDAYTTCGGTVECTFPAGGGPVNGTYSGVCDKQGLKFGGRFSGNFTGGWDGTFSGSFNGWFTIISFGGQQHNGSRHGSWTGRVSNDAVFTGRFVDSSGGEGNGNVHANFSKSAFESEYQKYLNSIKPKETPKPSVNGSSKGIVSYNKDGSITVDGITYKSYEEWRDSIDRKQVAPGVELYVKDFFEKAKAWRGMVSNAREAYVIRDGQKIPLEYSWNLMPGDIIETKTDKGEVNVTHGRLHFNLRGEGSRVQVLTADQLDKEDWGGVVRAYGKPGEVLVMEPGTMVIKYESQGETGYHLPDNVPADEKGEKCIGDECNIEGNPFVVIGHDNYEDRMIEQIRKMEDDGYVYPPPKPIPEEERQNAAEMLLTWMWGLYVENKSTVEYVYDRDKLELDIKVYEGEAEIRRVNFKTKENTSAVKVKAGESIKIALADFVKAKGETGSVKGEFDVNEKSEGLISLEKSITETKKLEGKGINKYIKIVSGVVGLLVLAAAAFFVFKKLLSKKGKGGEKSQESGGGKDIKKPSTVATVKIPRKVLIIAVFVLLLLAVGFFIFKNKSFISNLFTSKGEEKVATGVEEEGVVTESDSAESEPEAEVEGEESQQAKPIDQFTKTQLKGKVAFERDRDIWFANSDGSNEKQLTTYKGLWSPFFSPDGKWIAYSSVPQELYGQGMAPMPANIWIISPDGEDYKKLSQEYRVSTEVTWSPDSQKIAIATSDETIVVFDVNTGEEMEFINDAGPLGVIPSPPVWLTNDTFVYFRKLPDAPSLAGLAVANIKTKKTEWLTKKSGIDNLASSNNGKKLYYFTDREFYQIDIKTKKETKLNWDLADNVSFIADFKILKNSNTLMAPVHIEEEKAYPGSHIDFILINTISGKSVLKRTGLQYKKNLGWDSDGYWLLLNAISPNDDIPTIWKVNLETEKKDQLINNAYSSSWSF